MAGIGDFVSPLVSSTEWMNRDEVLESLRAAASSGHGLATLHALWLCFVLSPGEPVPGWIRCAVCTGIAGWKNHTWDSLENAFGAKRPRTKSTSAHFAAHHHAQILLDYGQAMAANVDSNQLLYERIGARYNLAWKTIERIVQAMRAEPPTASQSDLARSKRRKRAG